MLARIPGCTESEKLER